ncbi:hypothetical protein DJ68_00205, partial [Halorubrum sp. C3]
ETSDRGAQRAYGVLATGALEVFAVDPRSIIYKRATGALEVFSVDPSSATYKLPPSTSSFNKIYQS